MASSFSVIGQTAAPASQRSCFSEDEINPAIEKLPPSYYGNDLSFLLFKLSERTVLTKDEFETTKQFNERVALENAKPLIGKLNFNNLFAFQVGAYFSYDADTEKMSALMSFDRPEFYIKDCATKKNPAVKDIPNLIFRNDFSGYNSRTWQQSFSIPVSDARKIKPNLKLLLIVNLLRSNTALLREIWVYDISDGRVFIKEKIKPPAPQEAEAQLAAAEKFYKENNYEDAFSLLRRVLASNPMNADAYVLMGKIHLKKRDFEQAVSSFKTGLFWDNKIIEAHLGLATIYLERRDCIQARNYSSSALAIDSNNKDAISLNRQTIECR